MLYDPTAGYIETPDGVGRFIEFDGCNKTVTVEMDNMYLVQYPAKDCYLFEGCVINNERQSSGKNCGGNAKR